MPAMNRRKRLISKFKTNAANWNVIDFAFEKIFVHYFYKNVHNQIYLELNGLY